MAVVKRRKGLWLRVPLADPTRPPTQVVTSRSIFGQEEGGGGGELRACAECVALTLGILVRLRGVCALRHRELCGGGEMGELVRPCIHARHLPCAQRR
jgi:hypothetical protein